jgi:hypothetical protein
LARVFFHRHKQLYADITRVSGRLRRLGVGLKKRRIVLTYVGRFETIPDLGRRVDQVNGVPRGVGLGQGNWAPAAMVVKAVRDLTLE